MLATHVVIPDTQIKPGGNHDHVGWAGQYLVDQFAGNPDVTVVALGDWWDMPSLSSYDRGKRAAEGRRYTADIDAGNQAMAAFLAPLKTHNRGRRKKWAPRLVFLHGNHEDRISRAANDEAWLDGAVSLDHLHLDGWEVHRFLEVVNIDGVLYSHYFYQPNTGRAYGGQSIETRLRAIGASFTQGHQQGLMWGRRECVGGVHIGCVAGSFYIDAEQYRGPQAAAEWRGLVVKHQVEAGAYDPMFVSLDYLCRRYEGVTLKVWEAERGG